MNSTGQQEPSLQPSGYDTVRGPQAKRLAELLQALRQREGLSVEVLAHRLGVGRSTVVRIEAGTRDVRMSLLFRWCEVVKEPPSRVVKFVSIKTEQ